MDGSRTIAIVGSGGAGVVSAGTVLLDAAARAGYYGALRSVFGPQVAGGEVAAVLTIADAPVEGRAELIDLLVALDWHRADRLIDDLPLGERSVLVGDRPHGDVPQVFLRHAPKCVTLPQSAEPTAPACTTGNGVGIVAGALALPLPIVQVLMAARMQDRSAAEQASVAAAIAAGYERGAALDLGFALDPARPTAATDGRWSISGNEAVALGALRGGVRFVAGYPIAPATDLMTWIAPRVQGLGGTFVQAEDELSALHLALGASFGGVPSMTATSGPGLSLMVEGLGVASATELPVLVVDVQRCGPSSGMATRTEQSDLNLAVYGAHGDAPRVVIAPISIRDAVDTAEWGVELAERLQSPVVLLSDQALAQSRAIVDAVPSRPRALVRDRWKSAGRTTYERYAITPDGVSPISDPGTPGALWKAESATHDDGGAPSEAAQHHASQLEKRAAKLALHDFGTRWGDASGDGDLAVIAWGSSVAPAREAVARLHADSASLRFVALRLLAPVPLAQLTAALRGVRALLVIELNLSGQLHQLLRASGAGPWRVDRYGRSGPQLFTATEIHAAIVAWSHQQ